MIQSNPIKAYKEAKALGEVSSMEKFALWLESSIEELKGKDNYDDRQKLKTLNETKDKLIEFVKEDRQVSMNNARIRDPWLNRLLNEVDE